MSSNFSDKDTRPKHTPRGSHAEATQGPLRLGLSSGLLTIGFALAIIAITIFLGLKLQSVAEQNRTFVETSHKRLEYLSRLERHLGFGGLIHDFKNYLLRQEERYLEGFEKQRNNIEQDISDYLDLKPTGAEIIALDNIRYTVNRYTENLAIAQHLIRQARESGETIDLTTIDSVIRIDDRPAINALKNLESAALGRASPSILSAIDVVEISRMMIWGGVFLGLAFLGIGGLNFYQTFRYARSLSKLARERANFNLLTEITREGIITCNREGRILTFNAGAEKIFGRRRTDVIGRFLGDFIHVADVKITPQTLATLFSPGEHSAPLGHWRDTSGIREDGTKIPLLVTLTRSDQLDEAGDLIGVTVNDMSDSYDAELALLKAKEEAQEASQSRTRFLAMMSHEIRTPMNAIIGFSELLQSSELSKQQREFNGYVTAAASGLLRIINDILDFAKIDEGKFEIYPHPVMLQEHLGHALLALQTQALDKKLTLESNIDLPDRKAIADGERIEQIVTNLLSNAVKFTDQGHITLSARSLPLQESAEQEGPAKEAEAQMLEILVEDSGCGLSSEELERMFEPFEQMSNTASDGQKGTGLGLTISRLLAKAMGGELTATSTKGAGTTMRLRLPLRYSDERAAPIPHLAEQLPATHGTQRGTALVVEDNELNALYTKTLLERMGFDVEIAVSGEQALEMTAGKSYKFILMDVQMPEMNGIEATKRIRSLKGEGRDVPIIGYSAHTFDSDRKACVNAGMNDFIPKPVRPQTLEQVVNRFTTH